MVMVKAFSYGSGSFEIANVLQFHRVDYLAVAYADEGIELRKAGITVPIMVMNPEEQSYDEMIRHNLEPELFSFRVLQLFDEAAKKFEHFLTFFERKYDCRVLVLRTDGGGEYANVDLFCKTTGVERQVTEANSSASNGKTERMHRTVLNMARCMIFNCGLPMRFWGDAVKYAAYVLNRSPTRSNPKRQSPIEMLEGHAPNLMDIVTFGSPCMVFHDAGIHALNKRATRGLILGRSEETK